jgi:hypothetical protein
MGREAQLGRAVSLSYRVGPRLGILLGGLFSLVVLAACLPGGLLEAQPTPLATLAQAADPVLLPSRTQSLPATAGPDLPTFTPSPSPTPGPSRTRLPTPTRFPTNTPFPTPTVTGTPPPAATPTATPTPLPGSPVPTATLFSLPMAPIEGSKMGLHVIQNNSPQIMEFVRRTHPAVMKAVGDVGWLAEVKAESPSTVTVGRLMATSQDIAGDPAQAARDFVGEQLPDYLLNRGEDYWEGWNEPDPNLDMNWYAAFEAERVRQLANYGLKAAVGGFSAGVPEYDEFFPFLPAIEAAWLYGGILSLHEYGAPTMDYLVGSPLPGRPAYADRGPLMLRYRWWYEDVLIPRGTIIPLVISEAGIDGIIMSGERPGPPGLGWRDFVHYWGDLGLGGGVEAYLNQLAWYDFELQTDRYVIGFTVFTAGGGSRWRSYEVNGILPELTAYVAQTK